MKLKNHIQITKKLINGSSELGQKDTPIRGFVLAVERKFPYLNMILIFLFALFFAIMLFAISFEDDWQIFLTLKNGTNLKIPNIWSLVGGLVATLLFMRKGLSSFKPVENYNFFTFYSLGKRSPYFFGFYGYDFIQFGQFGLIASIVVVMAFNHYYNTLILGLVLDFLLVAFLFLVFRLESKIHLLYQINRNKVLRAVGYGFLIAPCLLVNVQNTPLAIVYSMLLVAVDLYLKQYLQKHV